MYYRLLTATVFLLLPLSLSAKDDNTIDVSQQLVVAFERAARENIQPWASDGNVAAGRNWWLANSYVYKNAFVFSPRHLTWKAYNSRGRVIKSGRASGGRHYCPDVKRACRTPVGSFRIISKRGANCRSSRYPKPRGGAPMPYCMFFSKYYAIHGSYDVPRYNASHGCIRVRPKAAKWLSRNFIRHGTKVIVKPY